MTYQTAFAALGDPTRRKLLDRLRRRPLSVGELADGLPISRPAVSQHLRVLERARLVRARSEGTRRIYALEEAGWTDLRRYLESFWSTALREFAAEAKRQKGRANR